MGPVVTLKDGEVKMHVGGVGPWEEVVKSSFSHGMPDRVVSWSVCDIPWSDCIKGGVNKVVVVRFWVEADVAVWV